MKVKGYASQTLMSGLYKPFFGFQLENKDFSVHGHKEFKSQANAKRAAERLAKNLNLEIEWENG